MFFLFSEAIPFLFLPYWYSYQSDEQWCVSSERPLDQMPKRIHCMFCPRVACFTFHCPSPPIPSSFPALLLGPAALHVAHCMLPTAKSWGNVNVSQCKHPTCWLSTVHCALHTREGAEQCKGAVSALVLSHSSVCCERSAGPGSAVQCKPVKCTLQMTKFAVQTLWIRYIAEHPCVVCKWLQFSNGPPSPIRGNSKPSATRNLA